MDRRTVLVNGAVLAAGLALPAFAARREPVLGGPCEGCEWVFDDLPAKLGSHARIAPPGEPGDNMVIEGAVVMPRGSPAAGVIVYAYHTDRTGIYPPARNRHGRLRGWALTDERGGYRFDTIRPAAYPGRQVAEHVHMHVIEPGVGTYYIDNLLFEDDELLSAADRDSPGRGGKGLAAPLRRRGTWWIRRDITLGRNIRGYPSD
jgi:protocatechuate 3,4-dioxygenase beta subunit